MVLNFIQNACDSAVNVSVHVFGWRGWVLIG